MRIRRWELWSVINGEETLLSRHIFKFMAALDRDMKPWGLILAMTAGRGISVRLEIRRAA